MADYRTIVSRFERAQKNIIPALQAIQEEHGEITPDAVDAIAAGLGVTSGKVYGVATFYDMFRLSEPPDHTVHVCVGTSCFSLGAWDIVRALEDHTGVKAGEMTEDYFITVEGGTCPGTCAQAPVIKVDGKVYANVTPERAVELVRTLAPAGGDGE